MTTPALLLKVPYKWTSFRRIKSKYNRGKWCWQKGSNAWILRGLCQMIEGNLVEVKTRTRKVYFPQTGCREIVPVFYFRRTF